LMPVIFCRVRVVRECVRVPIQAPNLTYNLDYEIITLSAQIGADSF